MFIFDECDGVGRGVLYWTGYCTPYVKVTWAGDELSGYDAALQGCPIELFLQPADIGWPTGNGEKLSNSQAYSLAQLCLDIA